MKVARQLIAGYGCKPSLVPSGRLKENKNVCLGTFCTLIIPDGSTKSPSTVIPAKAGIQEAPRWYWIPASAGMTIFYLHDFLRVCQP